MSLQDKLIIPLLDDGITAEDLKESKGFVGLYTSDINRPYLDNHVFLLFSLDCINSESVERGVKFSKLKNLYNRKLTRINGKLYDIYAFTRSNFTIKSILKRSYIISDDEKIKIFKFWGLNDPEVNMYMLYGRIVNNYNENIIPEEDLTGYEKSQVLSI